MALLLDLACLSYRGLMRRSAMPVCLLLAVVLSVVGGTVLIDGIHSAPVQDVSTPGLQGFAGLLRLGKAWPGIEQPEMVSTGRLSSLAEMLTYLGCSVSPVFICGEDEEQHVQLETSDFYIRSGLMGVGADYGEIVGSALQVVDGRFFDNGEVDSAIRVAVIGTSLAALMHEPQSSTVSRHIAVEGASYEVIGVVAEGPGYRSRYEDMSLAERIILPYTTLADHAAASSDRQLDLRAVVYRHPESITGEFVDRVINDWLRRNDLLDGRFVSHVRSLPLTATGTAVDGRDSAMPGGVYAWIALFVAASTATLGYLRMADRIRELELMRTVGASPLHLLLQIGLESLFLVIPGTVVGVLVSTLVVRPVLQSLAGVMPASEASLRFWLAVMAVGFVSSAAGSIRFVASKRVL